MAKLNFQHLEPAIQLLESSVEYANLVLNNQLLTVLKTVAKELNEKIKITNVFYCHFWSILILTE